MPLSLYSIFAKSTVYAALVRRASPIYQRFFLIEGLCLVNAQKRENVSRWPVGPFARLAVGPNIKRSIGVMEYWREGNPQAAFNSAHIHHFMARLFPFANQHPARQRRASSIPVSSIQYQRFVVGRRLPNFTSQGEFLVTCFLRCLHHSDWNVRQLPSRASSLAKSACSHRRSHHLSLLVVTPALAFLGRFI